LAWDQAHRTQVWLATSDDPEARVTGQYFRHLRPRAPNPATLDTALQNRLLENLERLSGRIAARLTSGCDASLPTEPEALLYGDVGALRSAG
jgi:hypothetical protein